MPTINGRKIIAIGFFDSLALVAKRTFGNGDLRQDISEAVADAVFDACTVGEEFCFSHNVNDVWRFIEVYGQYYIERVDSASEIRIGIMRGKDIKAWVPRLKETMATLGEAGRFPDPSRIIPDRDSPETE